MYYIDEGTINLLKIENPFNNSHGGVLYHKADMLYTTLLPPSFHMQ
jgi:hypothetical protein